MKNLTKTLFLSLFILISCSKDIPFYKLEFKQYPKGKIDSKGKITWYNPPPPKGFFYFAPNEKEAYSGNVYLLDDDNQKILTFTIANGKMNSGWNIITKDGHQAYLNFDKLHKIYFALSEKTMEEYVADMHTALNAPPYTHPLWIQMDSTASQVISKRFGINEDIIDVLGLHGYRDNWPSATKPKINFDDK